MLKGYCEHCRHIVLKHVGYDKAEKVMCRVWKSLSCTTLKQVDIPKADWHIFFTASSDFVLQKPAETEQPKLSKKKLRKMNRLSVAELKQVKNVIRLLNMQLFCTGKFVMILWMSICIFGISDQFPFRMELINHTPYSKMAATRKKTGASCTKTRS